MVYQTFRPLLKYWAGYGVIGPFLVAEKKASRTTCNTLLTMPVTFYPGRIVLIICGKLTGMAIENIDS